MSALRADGRRTRAAVSLLFCTNGALLASFLPRLPALKDELDLTNTALGVGIAFMPAASLLASASAGWLVARFGSGRLAVLATMAYAALLPLLGLAPTWAAFAAVAFAFGLCDGVADVAQNAHGLRVQHAYGRSIINGFHAWWSVGGVIGGVSAAAAAAFEMPLATHLAVAGGILALAALAAGRWTLPGTDPGVNASAPQAPHEPPHEPYEIAQSHPRGARPARSALLPLAGIAGLTLMMAVIEDVPGTWGAIYLRDELGASAGFAGLAFAAFTAGMTVGRGVADKAVDRWGHVRVVRAGAAVTTIGFASAMIVGTPWSGIVGFFLVGLGAAPAIPALFHAAGHRPGVRPAQGVALVAWFARIGFMIAPPLVGVVADALSLGVAIVLGILAAVGVLAGASAARSATGTWRR